MTFGDISGDGHNQREQIHVSCNKPLHQVQQMYSVMNQQYEKPICQYFMGYAENKISVKDIMALSHSYYEKYYADQHDAEIRFYIEDLIDLLFHMLNEHYPELQIKPQPIHEWDIGLGYGLLK